MNTTIPDIYGVIERPRLLSELEASLKHKLTIISAPPGYGKTTLAAQFARRVDIPVVWHPVAERERDIPNLFQASLHSFKTLVPSVTDLRQIPGQSPDELAAILANRLREELTGQILYVLDDVHHIAGSPTAEAWLRSFIDQLPGYCHLIILSRILPDLPLTEMIARREVLAIGQDQLRFKVKELAELAQQSQHSIDLEQLLSKLEGWPAGTVLALQPLPEALERIFLKGSGGPEALFDALAELMLDAQPPGLRHFLLASSTLTRITPELCTRALGLVDTGHWLNVALNRNLFLSRISGALIYHRLFRTFLQNQLEHTDYEMFNRLHTNAAAWFEDQGRLEEAFDHYTLADQTTEAAAIAERVAQPYFFQGQLETLQDWMSKLANAPVIVPELIYSCAEIHIDRHDHDLALELLQQAEADYDAQDNPRGQIKVQLQRAWINLQRGQYPQAIDLINQLPAQQTIPSDLRGRALHILGYSKLRLGQIEEAADDLEASLEQHRSDNHMYAVSQVLQDLHITYVRLGRIDDASTCLQEVVAICRSLGSSTVLALALNDLGFFLHRHGDYLAALATMEEGLSIVAKVHNRRAESYLMWSLGDLQRDRGGFEEAWKRYEKALEFSHKNDPYLQCSLLISSSTLRRWEGQIDHAISFAEDALVLADSHSLALECHLARAALFTAKAQTGSPVNAQSELDQIVQALKQMSAHLELLQVYGLCALVALLRSDQPAAHGYLREAVDAAHDDGELQTLVVEVYHTPMLHSYVLAHASRYPEICQEINKLEKIRLTQAQGQQTQKNPQILHSFRVMALGRGHIERNGVVIPDSEWRSNLARELFFHLLFNGPTSKEQLGLAFWPDSSSKRVRQNFHTTLHRARKAMGELTIVYQDRHYCVNEDIDLRCDALEFERLIQQARLLSSRNPHTEDLWRRAVGLYRGEFLPRLDAEWIISYRERLHNAHIEALIGLGECYRTRNDVGKALDMFHRALEEDILREDVHRLIMLCYKSQGEAGKIQSQFRELKQLLQDEMGVEPSSETTTLVKTLLA